jgi:hypothetical protein
LVGGPGLVQVDPQGCSLMEVFNTGPEPMVLARGQEIGNSENMSGQRMTHFKAEVVNSIAEQQWCQRNGEKRGTTVTEEFRRLCKLKTLANPFSKLTSSPLTPEAMDEMVMVRPKCEILGAIARPENRAQIEALKAELFDLKENTGHLFEVVQDFSKTRSLFETGFNELRMTLLCQVMFNPTLFDTRLSRIENQLCNRLCRVTHAIQAAIHQRFAVD